MPKPRKIADLPKPLPKSGQDKESLINIVRTLNYLYSVAAKREIQEVADVIDSALNIVSVAYSLLPMEELRSATGDQELPSRTLPHRVEDLEDLVTAMDFMAKKAEALDAREASIVISSAFQIICASYYCILRHNMLDLPASGMIREECDDPAD